MHHVLLAHGRATQVMRGLGIKNLGAVCNLEYAEPADGSRGAEAAAALYDAYYNRFFLSGLFLKDYPEELMAGLGPHLPDRWWDDMEVIGTRLDWCGLNYYTRKLIAPNDGPWPGHHELDGPLPKTEMGWEIYPEGLYRFLKRIHRDFTRGLPLYVTENGMANADVVTAGEVNDPARIDYIDAHLAAVKRAGAEGVPVRGYFVWSLLDNYEWALGYDKRFGIVHVDFDTLERTPKASWHALRDALAR